MKFRHSLVICMCLLVASCEIHNYELRWIADQCDGYEKIAKVWNYGGRPKALCTDDKEVIAKSKER